MQITGNTVFIPGATSGIGLALARRLHAAGNTVIIGGRRTELLESIAADEPGLHTVRIDTADPASIEAAAKQDGLLLCPEGGATLAAYHQALNTGLVDEDDKVVLFNCATGLKYPMPEAPQALDRTRPIDFDAL